MIRIYSSEETPYKAIKVVNLDDGDDDDLENALFQASKHVAEYDVFLFGWLATCCQIRRTLRG